MTDTQSVKNTIDAKNLCNKNGYDYYMMGCKDKNNQYSIYCGNSQYTANKDNQLQLDSRNKTEEQCFNSIPSSLQGNKCNSVILGSTEDIEISGKSCVEYSFNSELGTNSVECDGINNYIDIPVNQGGYGILFCKNKCPTGKMRIKLPDNKYACF